MLHTNKLHNGYQLPIFLMVCFILEFFLSVQSSFLLNFNPFLFNGLLYIGIYLSFFKRRYLFSLTKRTCWIAFFFFASVMLAEKGTFNGYIGKFLLVAPFICFLFLKDCYKVSFLNLLDKVLSYLVLLSLFWWILFLIGLPLPFYSFEWKSYSFDNYILFLIIDNPFYAFPRFQFIFTEPGYFGCLMVFMIFFHKYNFHNWHTCIYLLALFFTFSLAGYILFFIGLIPYILSDKKKRLLHFIFLITLLGVFFYLIGEGKDNVINDMFSHRLVFEDGKMSGYNRNVKDFDYWWNNYFLVHGDIFWGSYENVLYEFEDEFFGVDLRAYVARYGIIPLCLYFLSMFLDYKRNKGFRNWWVFLLFLIFYYRGYTVMLYIGFPMLYNSLLIYFKPETRNNITKA